MSLMAIMVIVTPMTMLLATYANAVATWPEDRSWKVSLLKVEKVVKPPQRPTTNSNLISSVRCHRAMAAVMSPMSKHPMMFVVKVPHGNEPWHEPLTILPTR